MAPITIEPTKADLFIANSIAAHTSKVPEEIARAITWGADEHLLIAVAAAGWLYARLQKPTIQPAADHALLTTVVAAARRLGRPETPSDSAPQNQKDAGKSLL